MASVHEHFVLLDNKNVRKKSPSIALWKQQCETLVFATSTIAMLSVPLLGGEKDRVANLRGPCCNASWSSGNGRQCGHQCFITCICHQKCSWPSCYHIAICTFMCGHWGFNGSLIDSQANHFLPYSCNLLMIIDELPIKLTSWEKLKTWPVVVKGALASYIFIPKILCALLFAASPQRSFNTVEQAKFTSAYISRIRELVSHLRSYRTRSIGCLVTLSTTRGDDASVGEFQSRRSRLKWRKIRSITSQNYYSMIHW